TQASRAPKEPAGSRASATTSGCARRKRGWCGSCATFAGAVWTGCSQPQSAPRSSRRPDMSVRIRALDETNAAAWDAFVRARPEGSFFHLSAWARVIAQSFGHPTHYVLAELDGAVVGVLPLVRTKTLLFGDLLASTPYCVYGGALAATPEGSAALDAY